MRSSSIIKRSPTKNRGQHSGILNNTLQTLQSEDSPAAGPRTRNPKSLGTGGKKMKMNTIDSNFIRACMAEEAAKREVAKSKLDKFRSKWEK